MMKKSAVVLALLAFAAFASATGDVERHQVAADALAPLSRAGGRSLKTFGWLLNLWGGYDKDFCLATDFKLDFSCFLGKQWWDSVYEDDWKCKDRLWICGSYRHKCMANCGGVDYYYQQRSWTKYWCPGTCGYTGGCDDYMPSCYCQQYSNLCGTVDNKCYSWFGKPFWYWCMATCRKCGSP